MNSPEVVFLKPLEAAAFLRVKLSTLYKWVHRREIPFRKHGRYLVFEQNSLIDWSDKRETKPL